MMGMLGLLNSGPSGQVIDGADEVADCGDW